MISLLRYNFKVNFGGILNRSNLGLSLGTGAAVFNNSITGNTATRTGTTSDGGTASGGDYNYTGGAGMYVQFSVGTQNTQYGASVGVYLNGLSQRQRKRMEQLINYIGANWTDWLFLTVTGTAAWGCQVLAKRQKDEAKKNKTLCESVQVLLRDRIIETYNHYNEKGYCPIYAQESMRRLYGVSRPGRERRGDGTEGEAFGNARGNEMGS